MSLTERDCKTNHPCREIVVMGVRFRNQYFQEAVESVERLIENGKKESVFFLNADCLYKAQFDSEYRDILNFNEWVLPDGIGLKIISSIFGSNMLDNCNGTELTPVVLSFAAKKGYSVYLLGSREGVAGRAADMAKKDLTVLK